MVVAEYLAGGITLRELGQKYGLNFRQIHRWIKAHERAEAEEKLAVKRAARSLATSQEEIPADVETLQKQLYEARLHAKLLNAMIDIAEEQFEIPIRKKSGARQS
jgi:transposase-like protein